MSRHAQIPKQHFAISLQYLKKEVGKEPDFLHADKHESFLQVDLNTLGYNISLLMNIIKHSEIN